MRCPLDAFFPQMPLPHLLEEFELVRFVGGPAHVKDVRLYLALDDLMH